MEQPTETTGFEATEKILLYYPTIDIPSPGWLRQGLMYWDKIASIVPQSYDNHLPSNLRYSDQIQPLYDAELFRPFNPADLVEKGILSGEYDEFQQELFKSIESPEFQRKLLPLEERKYEAEVYRDKLNRELFNELEICGLVKKGNSSKYYYFEKNAASLYMAILAKYLADIDRDYTVPSTDSQEYQDFNYKPADEETSQDIIACLQVEFRDLLRVPDNRVPIEKVIEFRIKRNDELLAFRREVLDKFEEELKKTEGSKREIKRKTVGFRQSIDKGVRDLEKLYRDEQMLTVTGTLKAIFKPQTLSTIVGAGTTAGVVGGPATGAFVSVAALAGAAAIEVFDFFVSRRNVKRDKLRTQAYSYLYLAQQELSVSKNN